MDLPISNLKRDEYYTFINGLAIASIWIIYFKKLSILVPIESVASPLFIAIWLMCTGLLWIFYTALSFIFWSHVDQQLKKKDLTKLLEKYKLSKTSLIYTGPLEERQMNTHIFGLLTTSLIFVYFPVSSYFPASITIFMMLHVVYTIITLIPLYFFKCEILDLASIGLIINTSTCDILNEKIYAQKRAELFAEFKHEEYKKFFDTRRPDQRTENGPGCCATIIMRLFQS